METMREMLLDGADATPGQRDDVVRWLKELFGTKATAKAVKAIVRGTVWEPALAPDDPALEVFRDAHRRTKLLADGGQPLRWLPEPTRLGLIRGNETILRKVFRPARDVRAEDIADLRAWTRRLVAAAPEAHPREPAASVPAEKRSVGAAALGRVSRLTAAQALARLDARRMELAASYRNAPERESHLLDARRDRLAAEILEAKAGHLASTYAQDREFTELAKRTRKLRWHPPVVRDAKIISGGLPELGKRR
ncbi:hypothetical protein [Arthrobacter sp. KK5.5]|uniref:hypothetical protein n=1 Tax=Arthrobacter sp. KK5.5 TaxID=3373084 RepID=UPI003EE67329